MLNNELLNGLKWNNSGLIPAIIQDITTKQVLMVAYMNEESLSKTLATNETWFWSRSRQELWHKGETSGNIQKVVSIKPDCDHDSLLIMVRQTGVACHTGSYSCFGDKDEYSDFQIISVLIKIISKRDAERPEGSYTTYLLEQGLDKILKKVGEEASEVIIASKNTDNNELIYEASDLLYHLLVLLHVKGVGINEVLAELMQRHSSH